MTREVKITNEARANGNHSIYVREGHLWNYTGLTFGARRDAESVVSALRRHWMRESTDLWLAAREEG